MEDGEIDPFLGGSMVNPSTPSSDFHRSVAHFSLQWPYQFLHNSTHTIYFILFSRQESADSGLGMGNSYSLPNTPEDFLSNMDDNMDTISGLFYPRVYYPSETEWCDSDEMAD